MSSDAYFVLTCKENIRKLSCWRFRFFPFACVDTAQPRLSHFVYRTKTNSAGCPLYPSDLGVWSYARFNFSPQSSKSCSHAHRHRLILHFQSDPVRAVSSSSTSEEASNNFRCSISGFPGFDMVKGGLQSVFFYLLSCFMYDEANNAIKYRILVQYYIMRSKFYWLLFASSSLYSIE